MATSSSSSSSVIWFSPPRAMSEGLPSPCAQSPSRPGGHGGNAFPERCTGGKIVTVPENGFSLNVIDSNNSRPPFKVYGYYPSSKVFILKEEVSLKIGLPSSAFRICYAYRVLEDEETLGDSNVIEGGEILVVPPPKVDYVL